MSSGLYTHTTRATGTVLTAAIYNADHVNHITNLNPQNIGGLSDSVSQMQGTTNPGGVGSESLATNVQGELQRIRWQLNAIIGGAQWYVAPATNLTTLAGAGVADNSITNAKLADMAQATIKARGAGIGTGDPQDLTLTQVMDFVGSAANGDLFYRTGGNWSRLGIGSANQVLTVVSSLPAWAAAAAGIGAIAPQAEVRTGSATITIPTNATKLLCFLVGGSGGGGAAHQVPACGCTSAQNGLGGCGGGGGGLVKYLSGLTPGNTLSLTIGGAGSGGTTPANNGTAGGNSVLQSGSQSITTLTANGGSGGNGANGASGTGGAGGGASNGDANFAGENGGNGISGRGGTAFAFGGGGQILIGTAGQAGQGFGAGGAGGYANSATDRAGGAGVGGIALFFWFQ